MNHGVKYILTAFCAAVLVSLEALCLPASYRFALKSNSQSYEGSYRELELSVGDIPVGTVSYTISHNTSHPSHIHALHVQQQHRTKNGYGKVLLYSAINDILTAGGNSIELTRGPFNLKPADAYSQRDNELKRLYGSFGFVEKFGGRTMVLAAPQRFIGTEVVTSFSENGVTFRLRSKQSDAAPFNSQPTNACI